MQVAELVPWLNIPLLLYCVTQLVQINSRLAGLDAVQRSQGARLEKLDGLKS